jgi:nitroreductase
MEYPSPIEAYRKPEHAIDPIFLKRWSPRSMTGAKLELSTLMTLFEAARWAPSSGNTQSWRFVYALRDTPGFQRLFEALMPGNQAWCIKASVLILMISKTHNERTEKPQRTHSFDTGSAWVSLALQGSLLNLVVHGMEGFDYVKAAEAVSLPEGYNVEAIAAVGHPAPVEELPERYREMEKPNVRKRVEEFAFAEKWPEKPS